MYVNLVIMVSIRDSKQVSSFLIGLGVVGSPTDWAASLCLVSHEGNYTQGTTNKRYNLFSEFYKE